MYIYTQRERERERERGGEREGEREREEREREMRQREREERGRERDLPDAVGGDDAVLEEVLLSPCFGFRVTLLTHTECLHGRFAGVNFPTNSST